VIRLAAPLVASLALLATFALGQQLTSEQIEMLKSLSPEEKAELMRAYGLEPGTIDTQPTRDVSQPEIFVPREQLPSDIERELTAKAKGEMSLMDVLDATPDSLLDEDLEYPGVAEDSLLRSQPLRIDVELKQFGYDLFASAPTTFAPATDIPVGPNYIIGPGDQIRFQLYGKTYVTMDLTVDRDGLIAFPELGPVSVAGLSFTEMKDAIAREVDNRMIGTEVSITMGRLRSIRVFVLGDVFRPGSYTVSGLSTLTNALFVCGGVQKIGSLRRIQLKRQGELVQEFDLYDLLLEGDTSGDARLMPMDVIFVPPVGPLVGVAGEVRRPAIYELRGEMTASDLLDVAGGLRATAYEDLIQLERVDNGRHVAFDFALPELTDTRLQDGDLLKIYPIIQREERVVFIEGNVQRPGMRQYTDGMQLLDLIPSVDELLPESYFAYGLIERENELTREPQYLAFDLGAALIDGNERENVALRPRDRVHVFNRDNFVETPVVTINGRVQNPGEYELRKDMRVLDLILTAGGLERDAWMHETGLFRTDPSNLDVTKQSLDLSRILADDAMHNLVLQDLDAVTIHSIWEFREREEVEILGEVNYPGTYPRFEGMRLSDLLFAGGWLLESAYKEEAELTRYEVVANERRELHHLRLDLRAVLDGEPEADILLQPHDRLLVRRLSNWREGEVVHVSGEVAFPGDYPIEEGERISELITRFGGFLDEAYLPAAVFTREDIRVLQQEQLDRMADQLEADLARAAVQVTGGEEEREARKRKIALEAGQQLAKKLRSTQAVGRLVIQLKAANELEGTRFDLVLKDDDRLHVPKKPNYVMAMGQVRNTTAFQHEERKSAGHYIELAGGYTRFADKKRTYIVLADGSIEVNRSAKLFPGDVIVVPENLERFSTMNFLLDFSKIAYQLGLAAASAKTVGLY